MLGGTPYYATPSHFIKNDVLIYKFKNLGKILHLQDWHATLIMIYKVITGDLLFDQTARLFSEIRDLMVNATELYRNWNYQKQGSDEFENTLNQINTFIANKGIQS